MSGDAAPTFRLMTPPPRDPARWTALRAAAQVEGFRMVERLWRDCARLEPPAIAIGAALAHDDALIAVGALTLDPYDPEALRMRRFFTAPAARRLGVARAIANALIAVARATQRPIVVNAGTPDAPAFWRAMGFIAEARDGHSHRLPSFDPGSAPEARRAQKQREPF